MTTGATAWLELARAGWDQASVRTLEAAAAQVPGGDAGRRSTTDELLAAVDLALEAADGEAALALLAVLAARGPLDPDRVRRTLPFVPDPALVPPLVGAAGGDRAALLLGAIDDGALLLEDRVTACGLLVLLCEQEQRPLPDEVTVELRLVTHEQLDADTGDLLGALASGIDDQDLHACAGQWLERGKRLRGGYLSRLKKELARPLRAALPEDGRVEGDGQPLEAAARVGRNDACPCGSGKKFKKCCEGKAPAAAPAAAKSEAKRPETKRGRLPRPLTSEALLNVRAADLVAFDPAGRTEEELSLILREAMARRLWATAERAAEAHAGVVTPQRLDDVRVELMDVAAGARQKELVLRLRDRLAPELREQVELEVDLVARLIPPGPDLQALEAAARQAVEEEEAPYASELARLLLPHLPATGVLLARGALHPARVAESDGLLDEIEFARDRLLVPASDPWATLFDRMTGRGRRKGKLVRLPGAASIADEEEDEADEEEETTDALRERLRMQAARIEGLEADLAAARAAQPVEKRKRAAAPRASAAQLAKLKERNEKLEAVIEEGKEERRQLREELEALREAQAAAPSEPRAEEGPAEAEDPAEGDAIPALASRPTLLPVFSDVAARRLAEADRTLARTSLRVVLGLASGDPSVWGQAKRLQARDVMSARAGIHYRVLFRVTDTRLDVLTIINRKELDATLRKL